jgi:hypothetical protein
MADASTSKPTRIGDTGADEIIGAFLTDDDLVEHLRARASQVGLSYGVLDAIAAWAKVLLANILRPFARVCSP